MLGIEVMPGRLDSSMRFIEIKLSVLRSPRLYSRLRLLVRRSTTARFVWAAPDNPSPGPPRAVRPLWVMGLTAPGGPGLGLSGAAQSRKAHNAPPESESAEPVLSDTGRLAPAVKRPRHWHSKQFHCECASVTGKPKFGLESQA